MQAYNSILHTKSEKHSVTPSIQQTQEREQYRAPGCSCIKSASSGPVHALSQLISCLIVRETAPERPSQGYKRRFMHKFRLFLQILYPHYHARSGVHRDVCFPRTKSRWTASTAVTIHTLLCAFIAPLALIFFCQFTLFPHIYIYYSYTLTVSPAHTISQLKLSTRALKHHNMFKQQRGVYQSETTCRAVEKNRRP